MFLGVSINLTTRPGFAFNFWIKTSVESQLISVRLSLRKLWDSGNCRHAFSSQVAFKARRTCSRSRLSIPDDNCFLNWTVSVLGVIVAAAAAAARTSNKL